MTSKPWTSREESETMEVFAKDGSYAAAEFSGRSVQAVRTRASELGVRAEMTVHRDGLTAKVLAMLSDGPVCAYDVIAEHGCTRRTASMCLGRLARSGRVERFGGYMNRMYRLTDCNR